MDSGIKQVVTQNIAGIIARLILKIVAIAVGGAGISQVQTSTINAISLIIAAAVVLAAEQIWGVIATAKVKQKEQADTKTAILGPTTPAVTAQVTANVVQVQDPKLPNPEPIIDPITASNL